MRVLVSALTAPNDGPLGDSALAVDDGTAILLNQNDARPLGFSTLRAFAGDAGYDAHLLQFSGAIWWPMVYDLPAKTMAKVGAEKRHNGMERALRYATDIDAAFVFPIAGPPCFLDEQLRQHNDTTDDPSNVFPDATVFIDYLADRGRDNGRLLIPGSTAEVLAAAPESARAATTCTVTHPLPDEEVTAIFTDKAATSTPTPPARRSGSPPSVRAGRPPTWTCSASCAPGSSRCSSCRSTSPRASATRSSWWSSATPRRRSAIADGPTSRS